MYETFINLLPDWFGDVMNIEKYKNVKKINSNTDVCVGEIKMVKA